MEILSDILKSLQVDGSVYFCDQLTAPWQIACEDKKTASFHLVRQGHCWVQIGKQIEQLKSGDLIFFGPHINHTLTSHQPNSSNADSSDATLLLCGHCQFNSDTLSPLTDIFPSMTIVRADELKNHPWLRSTFEQLSAEYMAQKPGTELIVNKLTEVVLVELIRINFGRQSQHPFLLALADNRISKSLKLIHGSPQTSWTIEQLASEIGMSRAAFAKQFKELIGLPVFGYLSQLRVQKAKELLSNTQLAVDDIALEVGYESERAFTKTFKNYVGLTPKQYKNQ